MKIGYFILFLSVFFSFSVDESKSQSSVEVYGISPLAFSGTTKIMSGGGTGIGFFTPEMELVPEKEKDSIKPKFPVPINFSVGASVLLASMGHSNTYLMPLASPDTGKATVHLNNCLYSLNFSARFSTKLCNDHIIPYSETFVGFRGVSSTLKVNPTGMGAAPSSTVLLTSISPDIGMSAGVMFQVKGTRFDIGCLWSHTLFTNSIADLQSVNVDDGTLDVTQMQCPFDFFILKTGISFDLGRSKHEPGVDPCSGINYNHVYVPQCVTHGTCGHSWGHCSGGHSGHVKVHIK